MTHAEERELYESDHAAWCRYAAPRWKAQLAGASEAAKRNAWAIASPELKAEIKRIAKDPER